MFHSFFYQPNDRTHDVFSGRSFAPKDLATVEGDDVDFDLTSPMPQDLHDSVFFDFHHEIHDVIQEEPEVLQDELPAPPEIPERAASPAL